MRKARTQEEPNASLFTRVMSFRKRVNNVGTEIIGGGTQTKNAGIQIGIGMTTTTEITATMMMTIVVSCETRVKEKQLDS